MNDERIILDWRDAHDETGRWANRWDYNLALYAILHPRRDELLYLGKADGCTVRSRWYADDKHERVWRRIEEERRVFKHGFIVGEFRLPEGQRLTRHLVCDVESFLIHEVKPGQMAAMLNPEGSTRGPEWSSPARDSGLYGGRPSAIVRVQASEGHTVAQLPRNAPPASTSAHGLKRRRATSPD